MDKLDLKALLKDESFINYCNNSHLADVKKWEVWLAANPQYREEIEGQKQIVQTLSIQAATQVVEQNYTKLRQRIAQTNPKRDNRFFRFSPGLKVAAALLLVASIAYLINILQKPLEGDAFATQDSVVLPGDDKALLTLADGTTISLAEVGVGTLALQGDLRLEKTADGDIVYHTEKMGKDLHNAYNSIATPKGGQYKITLPDGSIAWLNASSSLRYPVEFTEEERRIEMTGEVYFQIAKMSKRTAHGTEAIPFYVKTDKQEIQVLGTHFNVNAYHNESSTITTLLEGSVRVTSSANGESVLLKPGQQAILNRSLLVNQADVDQQIAWTKGDFIFQGEELESILRKVARWYDVEVDCPSDLGKLRFDGIVSRKQPLTTIIEMIQTTGKAKMKIQGRRIIVTN